MTQFEVFANPVARARASYPFVVMPVTTIPVQSLGRAVASLADRRDDILAAIDYLFFGV
jgi:hypothetical protein